MYDSSNISMMTHLTGLFIGFDTGKVDELFRVRFGFGFVCALGSVVVPPPVFPFPPFFAISVSELELLFSNPESDSD